MREVELDRRGLKVWRGGGGGRGSGGKAEFGERVQRKGLMFGRMYIVKYRVRVLGALKGRRGGYRWQIYSERDREEMSKEKRRVGYRIESFEAVGRHDHQRFSAPQFSLFSILLQ